MRGTPRSNCSCGLDYEASCLWGKAELFPHEATTAVWVEPPQRPFRWGSFATHGGPLSPRKPLPKSRRALGAAHEATGWLGHTVPGVKIGAPAGIWQGA
uniref:Uncharacterized protein n=1 Tax=Varanus komodoensis TaxID=61221 RepID=A0A8D2ISU1_VARKO